MQDMLFQKTNILILFPKFITVTRRKVELKMPYLAKTIEEKQNPIKNLSSNSISEKSKVNPNAFYRAKKSEEWSF